MEGMAAEPGRPGLITTQSIHRKQNHDGATVTTTTCVAVAREPTWHRTAKAFPDQTRPVVARPCSATTC
jgi:hypothetical protein